MREGGREGGGKGREEEERKQARDHFIPVAIIPQTLLHYPTLSPMARIQTGHRRCVDTDILAASALNDRVSFKSPH